jgi:surface protein
MTKKNKILVKNKEHLLKLIKSEIKTQGIHADLNHLDVSFVVDMEALFAPVHQNCMFNGDISGWNVSNVKNMFGLFYGSEFNQDISQWNVSNVENMESMFVESHFNQDISNWNVSKVENMRFMFHEAQFNQNISLWDVSKVKDMSFIFAKSHFNLDLTLWRAIKLKDSLKVFDDSICIKPYWADCENNKILRGKIKEFQQNYQLKNKLENSLNEIKPNKKIKL